MTDKKYIQSIEDIFPIAMLKEGVVYSKNGDFSLIFEVCLPNLYSYYNYLSKDSGNFHGDLIHINEAFKTAISYLPDYSIVHKQDWFYRNEVKIKELPTKKSVPYLYEYNKAHFERREYLEHKCYLYLTKTSQKNVSQASNGSILATGKIVNSDLRESISTAPDFIEACNNFCSKINSLASNQINISIRRLETAEIVGDKKTIGMYEKYLSLQLSQDKAPLYDIISDNDNLRIGDNYSRIYTLTDIEDINSAVMIPFDKVCDLSTENTEITTSYATPLSLKLDCNHIYNQYIFINSKEDSINELEKNKKSMESFSEYSKENEVNFNKLDEFINHLTVTKTIAVKTHFNVQVFTEDSKKLKVIHNKTMEAFNLMEIKGRESKNDALFYFWAGIPGNASDLPEEDKFIAQLPLATCFFNYETNISIFKPKRFGVQLTERLSGKPINLDLSDRPKELGYINNCNKFIIAGSGGGKSFFCNVMLYKYFEYGCHMLIIDKGRSYFHLCNAVKGTFIEHTEKKPIEINPFYVDLSKIDVAGGDVEINKDEALKDFKSAKRDYLNSLLIILWKNSNEVIKKSEYTGISDMIELYYAHIELNTDIFPCFNSFFDFAQKEYKAILEKDKIPKEYFDLDNFLYVTKKFYSGGEYQFFLNSKTNINIEKEAFVVFETDTIVNNLIYFPVMILTMIQTYTEKMFTQRNLKKIIVFEEAWAALMNETMATYVDTLFRTVRKYGGEAWIITQNPNDLDNKFVKDSIITNTDTKILLDIKKFEKKFEHVANLLSLSQRDKNLILSINLDPPKNRRNKEVFVSFNGSQGNIYGVEVSKAEFFLYHTDDDLYQERVDLINKHKGNYEKAIAEFYTLG
jgi:conjugation system TraG family ATPase